jgi:hypothetical protein
MRRTCLLCQYLKDAELRSHHNGTGKRHGYDRISQRRWHNSGSERNPLQEVLRNSIKSHNATASFQFSISLRVFVDVSRDVDIPRHLFETITEFMDEFSQPKGEFTTSSMEILPWPWWQRIDR